MKKKKFISVFIALFLVFLWGSSTTRIRLLWGMVCEKFGQYERAINIYEQTVRKATIPVKNYIRKGLSLPIDKKYYLLKRIADFYFRIGDRENALLWYEKVKDAEPENKNDYINLSLLKDEARFFGKIFKDSELLQIYSQQFPEWVKSPYFQFQYAVFLAEEKQWYAARKILEGLVGRFPYLASFHWSLGQVLRRLGEYEVANRELDEAKRLNNTIDEQRQSVSAENNLLRPDCVGFWEFNGSMNRCVRDSSGRWNTASLVGNVRLEKGKIEDGVALNGVYSKVVISPSKSINLDNKDFTLALWMKPALQHSYRFVYEKKGLFLGLYGTDDNIWCYRIGDYRETGRKTYAAITHPIEENNWYFSVQRVINGIEHGVWLFNEHGLIEHAVYNNIDVMKETDQYPLVLGERTYFKTPNNYFKGVIDNVIVFDRALSDNEINSMYNYYSS